jgi:hypothetical protein
MKTLAIAIALSAGFKLSAETFIGLTSATNRLVVGTNEALIISKLGFNAALRFQLVKDGNIHSTTALAVGPADSVVSSASPAALAGPCELIFTNEALVNFQRIITTSIHTVVLAPSATTNTTTITVPSGRQLRLFKPLPSNTQWAPLRVFRGTNGFTFSQAFSQYANEEFSGPLELIFLGPTSGQDSLIFSYALTDEAQSLPQGLGIQSPTGLFQFEVEKSTNLTNWVPVVIQTLREDQKAYYRLRITK